MARRPITTSSEERIHTATVDNVAGLRHEKMNAAFPTISRENFASEEEYRNALVAQYQAMRQQEFSYVISDEATKAYMVSAQANCQARARCQNTQAWQNYSQNRDQTLVADSCFSRTRDIAIRSDGLTTNGECCAISSASLVAQISGEMGYDGNRNLIQPKSRIITLPNGIKSVGADNNPGAASWIERLDSIPEKYRLTPAELARRYPGGVTLNRAIVDGVVKAGDEISIVTNPNNSNPNQTGCHAMVVVDVIKDEHDRVTSYTLQCNNPPCLRHVNASAPEYYGSKRLNCAVRVNDWMNDKIKEETPQNMTTEQLEAKVAEEHSRLSNTIDDLQRTERYLASNNNYMKTTNYNKIDGYCAHYNDLENTLTNDIAQQRLPVLEEEVRRKEQELNQREAELQQREEKYQADLLAFNPNAEISRPEGRPDGQEQGQEQGQGQEQPHTEQPRDVSQMNLSERAEYLDRKQEELRLREEALIDREYELSMKEADLTIEKAQAQMNRSNQIAQEQPRKNKTKNKQNHTQQPDTESSRLNNDRPPAQVTQPEIENIFPGEPQTVPVGSQTEPGEPQTVPVEPQTIPGEPQTVPVEPQTIQVEPQTVQVGPQTVQNRGSHEELREQTGEPQQSSFAEIKSGRMYIGTETRAMQQEHEELATQRDQNVSQAPTVTHILRISANGEKTLEKMDEPRTVPAEPQKNEPETPKVRTISLQQLQNALDRQRGR